MDSSLINLTQQIKATQNTRQDEKQKLQHLLDEIPIGIVRISMDQKVFYTNKKIESIIGYTQQDIPHLNLWWEKAFPNKEYRKIVIANWKRSVKESIKYDGHIYPDEYQVTSKNQTIKNIEISGIVFDDEILLTLNDLTERKIYEEQLKNAKKDADIANRSKSLFIANMSHEIRTPMNAVLGLTDLLLDITTNKEQMNYLDKISRSSKSLLQILNDILDYSKIEAQKVEIKKEEFLLKDLVENTVDLFIANIEQKGLHFKYTIDTTIPKSLMGDDLRFAQVLSNLLSNAIKFTHKGSISILITKHTSTKETITLEVAVKDTGIGISKKDQNKLFQQFSQVDDQTTKQYGGTGLGLSITKNLLTLMGGGIFVESTPDIGSCFTFTITFDKVKKSLLQRKNSKQPVATIEQELNLKEKRFLVVEDNQFNQEVMKGFLKKYQGEVLIASNGLEALEKLQNNSIDMIFMDLHMPIMDGLEATIEIRRLPDEKSKTLIIAMSAAVTQSDRELCIMSGMDDFIPKPIERKNLFTILKHYFLPQTNYISIVMEKFHIDKNEAIKYLTLILESTESIDEELKKHLDDNDSTQLKQLVHKLKNSLSALDENKILQPLFQTISQDLKNNSINKNEIRSLLEKVIQFQKEIQEGIEQ